MTRILLAAALLLVATAADALTCDVKKELLETVLAIQRFHEATSTAVIGDPARPSVIEGPVAIPRSLLRLEALRAQREYETQKERMFYVCGALLKTGQEKVLVENIIGAEMGARMTFVGAGVDNETVKQGHESILKLIRLAEPYFGGK